MAMLKHGLMLLCILLLIVAGIPLTTLRAAGPSSIAGHVHVGARRGIADVRVELLEAVSGRPVGTPLLVTTTDSRGAWAFNGLAPGDYVLRVVECGYMSGLPVTLSSGETTAALILDLPVAALLCAGAAAAPQANEDEGDDRNWFLIMLGPALAGAAAGFAYLLDAS